ncbi:MAG TPA: pyruvate kinase [Lentisphaeria bacterium]|nr:MAG: pyruvate kinase [Lentisphaerae bacterium GWF2_38_69]HBM17096.1 pyruvate kinase [Lentisphaeria bacterium]
MKKTKIIATIGPASDNFETIERMALAGMNVCRLNFSFGTPEEHFDMIKKVRDVSAKLNKPLAIIQCIQGPKIRMGKLKAPVTVKKDQLFVLTGRTEHKDEYTLPTTYEQIASDTEVGKTILIADGKIIAQVVSVDKGKKEVTCKVTEGGTILTGKGINLPYTKISLPSLTPKDIEDVKFAVKSGNIDYIDMSFVRHPEDVSKLRTILKELGGENIGIIAKIEKPEAVENIDGIIDEADGIMVARGDLADEVSFAKVPVIQKEIIRKASKKGKFTIVATEMLSSMVDNQLPTRAEASDVANAVFDGTDCVMLSNESAMGKFPVESVKVMAEIVIEAEKSIYRDGYSPKFELPDVHKLNEAICKAASELSYTLDNEVMAVFSRSGLTARILSKFRPECSIFAATLSRKTYQQLAIVHNINPIFIDDAQLGNNPYVTIPTMIKKYLLDNKLASKGQKMIGITGNFDTEQQWEINTIRVHAI